SADGDGVDEVAEIGDGDAEAINVVATNIEEVEVHGLRGAASGHAADKAELEHVEGRATRAVNAVRDAVAEGGRIVFHRDRARERGVRKVAGARRHVLVHRGASAVSGLMRADGRGGDG